MGVGFLFYVCGLSLLVVHPLGAFFAYFFSNATNAFGNLRVGGYLLSTLFAGIPFLIVLGVYQTRPKRLSEKTHRNFTYLTWILVFCASLYTQVLCFKELNTDAQAGLAFVIAPIYLGIYGVIYFMMVQALFFLLTLRSKG